jgi:GNAT superfamily N-acetyltransferase
MRRSRDTTVTMADPDGIRVRIVDATALRARHAELAALLADAIACNASVGYMLPLDRPAIDAYWQEVADAVEHGARVCFAALRGDRLVGTVQLVPSDKANQAHRADVQKLLVHSSVQRLGIGSSLMLALEAHAGAQGLALLILDTRTGSAADRHYRNWGWTPFGIVPGYARDPDGALSPCTFYYKHIAPPPERWAQRRE